MRNDPRDYGRLDEAEDSVESRGWRGMDMESHPTLVAPDKVWFAKNKRFNRLSAEDRKGVQQIAWTYLQAMTSFYGATIYRQPQTGLQWVLRCDEDQVVIDRPESSGVISLPEGVTIDAPVRMVQANHQILMFRGFGKDPLVWSPEVDPTHVDNTFTAVPANSGAVGLVDISQGDSAVFHQRRVWIVHSGDEVAVSDIDSIKDYLTLNDFFVEKGEHDVIVQLYPYGDESLVVFKDASLHVLSPTSGENVNTENKQIGSEVGLASYGAVSAMGNELWFLSTNAGVQNLRQVLDNRLQGSAESKSRDVAPILRRMNTGVGNVARMTYWANKLYLAIPLDASTENNGVLVYDRARKAWQGLDQAPHIRPAEWLRMQYQGFSRLFFCNPEGDLFLYEEGTQDYYGGQYYDVPGEVYIPLSPGNGRGWWTFTEGLVDIATGNNASAEFSIAVNGAPMPE